MLKNYLTIAIRNLMRHKLYSAINIAGLAIGMACCILILLFVRYEMSYDRFHENADRIYQVIRETRSEKTASSFSIGADGALGPTLQTEFPEVQKAVRFWPWGGQVEYQGKSLYQNIVLVDKTFFDVFAFAFLEGDPETAFQNPSGAVITEGMAKRLFGDINPIGKVFTVRPVYFQGDYTVTGVLKDPPEHSTVRFDFLVTNADRTQETRNLWDGWRPVESWRPVETYLLLSEGYDPKALERKLPEFMERHMGKAVRENNTYHLQPLTHRYLYFRSAFGINWYGDIQQVYQVSLIAAFILLLACVNFMNLATASSAIRAKEVGMRKVVGAHRGQLIRQFLGESILLAFMAMLLALGLAELALPTFNDLMMRKLSLDAGTYMALLPMLAGVGLLTGLFAGIYPAFALSAYLPGETLKGTFRSGSRGTRFRQGLVVFQFAISICLVLGTLVIHSQLRYILDKDRGFDTEHLVFLPIFGFSRGEMADPAGRLSARRATVKQEFLAHPNVLKATAFRYLPTVGIPLLRTVRPEGANGNEWRIPINEVDEDYLETLGIRLVSGQNLRPETENFTSAFIVNKAAVKQFGWDDPLGTGPIGKQIEWVGQGTGVVIGIMEDFHVASLHEHIGPHALVMRTSLFEHLGLKVRGERLAETMTFLEETWKRFVPGEPFNYAFADESLTWEYEHERRLSRIAGASSLLAILVASLGLFGLAAFTAQQRTKEIGIRKVLGASVSGIVLMLSRDFVKLVLIANLIAWPVAYYAMNRWLENFAYRMELGWEIFALSGGLALLIALLTVSGQAWKAARANPVDALRNE